MRFEEAFPILTTADLHRALTFYQGLLGFEETFRFPADGDPAYVGLRLGTSELGIGADAAVRGDADGPPHRFTLWTYVDDCDEAVEHLRSHGVTVTKEPVDQPWGERIAYVADPDGNPVIVAQRPSDATAEHGGR